MSFTSVVVQNFAMKKNVAGDTPRPTFPLIPCVGFSFLFENGFSLPLTCGLFWTLFLYVKVVGLRG